MSEQTDHPRTREAVIERLAEMMGQGVYTAETAARILDPFADDFDGKYDLWVAIAEEAEMAYKERAFTDAKPWEAIISGAQISALVCEIHGLAPSDMNMAGTGFTYDARHSENVESLVAYFNDEDA